MDQDELKFKALTEVRRYREMRVRQRKYISVSKDKILDLSFIERKIICKYLEGKKAKFFL